MPVFIWKQQDGWVTEEFDITIHHNEEFILKIFPKLDSESSLHFKQILKIDTKRGMYVYC